MVPYVYNTKTTPLHEACIIFRENFHDTLENREKRKSLAQRIFPRLRYTKIISKIMHYKCLELMFIHHHSPSILFTCLQGMPNHQ